MPFRATPRLPVRPVGTFEVRALVELTEQLAPKMPQPLLDLGLHPRLLASYHTLALLAAQLALLALPRFDSSVLRLGWWLCFVGMLAFATLLGLRWRARFRPSEAVVLESWAPWVSEQQADCGG